MKAMIFAAGKGTRISRHLSGEPKCTVMVAGEPLIHYTVRKLNEYGVTDITLVVGYHHDYIRKALADLSVNFVYNPFFEVSNSIGSAWFAKEALCGDDLLLMNGDVYMEDALIASLVSGKYAVPTLFSDETRKEEADYKFYYQNGKLLAYGKELTGDQITGEYIGVAIVNKDFLPTFRTRLEQMVDDGILTVWWENVLYTLSDDGADILVKDVNGKFWAEVDYIEDYQRIKSFAEG